MSGAASSQRPDLLIATALRLESWALRGAVPGARVQRVGMGPRRAQRAASSLHSQPAAAWAVAGVCGALDSELAPGDVVIASALLGPAGRRIELDAAPLARALAQAGIPAHCGTIACVAKPVTGAGRAALSARGACAVDMESFWLADAAGHRPVAVLRVVLDGPRDELWRVDLPLRIVTALRRLRAAAPALAVWAADVSAAASEGPADGRARSFHCRERPALA